MSRPRSYPYFAKTTYPTIGATSAWNQNMHSASLGDALLQASWAEAIHFPLPQVSAVIGPMQNFAPSENVRSDQEQWAGGEESGVAAVKTHTAPAPRLSKGPPTMAVWPS